MYQSIIEFDRWLLALFNGSNSNFVDAWMMVLTNGFTWVPLYIALLYIVVKNNDTMSQIVLVMACAIGCVVLTDGISDFLVKPMVERWRPSNDPFIKYDVAVVDGMRGTSYGFFSAHAANTFGIALFFCLLVRSKVLSVAMVMWSLVNCYTRMYLGLHYPLDIFCGLCCGALVAIGVYFLYFRVSRHLSPQTNFISSQYTTTGYNLDDISIVMLVLVAILTYTVLRAVCIYT